MVTALFSNNGVPRTVLVNGLGACLCSELGYSEFCSGMVLVVLDMDSGLGGNTTSIDSHLRTLRIVHRVICQNLLAYSRGLHLEYFHSCNAQAS